MKRAIFLGLGAAITAVAAIPALTATAQNFPPPPPATYYGTVPSGVGPGQAVIAIVSAGGQSATCGVGTTIADTSGVVYVVDVVADAQRAGCGAPGRNVQFYFVGNKQLATDTASWGGPGPSNRNLTGLNPALTVQNRLPHVAKDGTN
jgi:hypothetical protein